MRRGPNTQTCLERAEDGTPEREARTVHAWESTGLDIVQGTLSNTRHCVWCGKREHKTYGKRGGWLVTKEGQ